MRPALYGGRSSHHAGQAQPLSAPKIISADIVGPICESGDSFLQDWPIEKVKSREMCWHSGAPARMGSPNASNYNSRPRPAEMLVEGRKSRIIRRRESRADLIRGE